MVQSLPSMEVFYSLEVSSESWLIQKGISMVNKTMFINSMDLCLI